MRDQSIIIPDLIRKAAEVLGSDRVRQPQVPVPSRSSWSRSADIRIEQTLQAGHLVAKDFGLELGGPITCRVVPLQGRAGQITKHQGGWVIDIDESISRDARRLLATVAHEMAHVLLDGHAIRMGSEEEQELLTDAVAALGGFGEVMLVAYEKTETIPLIIVTIHKHSRIGYLSQASLRRLLRYQYRVASPSPYVLWGGVLANSGSMVCVGCSHRLRFPIGRSQLELRCPLCGVCQRFAVVARRTLLQLRIPGQFGQRFQFNSDTDSDSFRTAIPIQIGQ